MTAGKVQRIRRIDQTWNGSNGLGTREYIEDFGFVKQISSVPVDREALAPVRRRRNLCSDSFHYLEWPLRRRFDDRPGWQR
jgi:hypothetical protein